MDIIAEETNVTLVNATGKPYYPDGRRRWQMYKAPLWLNFSDPTVLHVPHGGGSSSNWTAELSIETKASSTPEWIELLVTGPGGISVAAHPIHLHGHDFALLAQSEQAYDENTVVIKRDNPPRRDVALLPQNGYLIIAFKADNPGTSVYLTGDPKG